MSEDVRIERDGSILTLVLNRPEKKNALLNAMYRTLADELTAAQGDESVAAIIIRGEGTMFTAGNDLSDFATSDPDRVAALEVWRFIRVLAANMKPLIAAVQGRAVGIGTTLLLHCDHVILADDAILTTPFVDLALVPEAGSSLLLPARIGYVRAFSMLALGEPVSAHQALEWGLANSVLPVNEIVPAAQAFAQRVSEKPLGALMAAKRLMRDVEALTTCMEAERLEFIARLSSPEAREAIAGFVNRREAKRPAAP